MSDVPVYKMKWKWLPDVREVRGMQVAIVISDEPPSPEYLVCINGTVDGVTEVARCDRFKPGALAHMTMVAEMVADLLELAECSWFEVGDSETNVPERPG
ncbi:hypothetical protein LGH83_04435 [Lichenihabitans sp. PAMC28606]|uniref:hypothetical protein n=1 Tax=Lichenihabitans sp. PAMC28606 TaxID=2880932 RepID=UPI001D0BD426|nr:hypothetical protein [Lichenihabitans sp. PAMC28606]UDL95474.1 hypothetical protein LGH83_04435 [Lichenihabitans sp. PAMC28606]